MHGKPFTDQVVFPALCSTIFIVPLRHCTCASLQSMLQRWTSWCRIVQGPSTHGKFLEECVYLIIFNGWFFSHVEEDLFGQVILSKWFLGFTYDLKNLFGRQNLNSEEEWQSKNLKEFVMSTF